MKDLVLQRWGVELELCPERAIYRPDRREVLVADVHLGKAAAFRTAGRPLPTGTTRRVLGRLDALLERKAATELTILGDLFHGDLDEAATTAREVRAWLEARPHVHVTLVAGNHDRHARDFIDTLSLVTVPEPLPAPPLAYRHFEAAEGPFLAGHVHPGVHLRDGTDAAKLPVFWLKPDGIILPAFGQFTGLHLVDPGPGESLAAVTETAVINLPCRYPRQAPS